MDHAIEALRVLQDAIDARTATIAAEHGDWPCRKGCGHCCRSLADAPRLTPPEWDLLKAGLARLPEPLRRQIRERVSALPVSGTRPVVCPLLNPDSGACLVYDHRPVACRTYGFYVERDRGLYCRDIEGMVERGECNGIVWGNAAAVESQLRGLGEEIDLRTWFRNELT